MKFGLYRFYLRQKFRTEPVEVRFSDVEWKVVTVLDPLANL